MHRCLVTPVFTMLKDALELEARGWNLLSCTWSWT